MRTRTLKNGYALTWLVIILTQTASLLQAMIATLRELRVLQNLQNAEEKLKKQGEEVSQKTEIS